MATQNIHITIKVSEIEYEVKDKTHLTGRALEAAGAEYKVVSSVQVTDDEERRSLLSRFIGNGLARVKQLLSEWLGSGTTSADNSLESRGQVTLTLKMPTNFATSATDDIAASIHRYITDYAIGSWFDITAKDRAADYYRLVAEEAAMLMLAVHRRKRPTRRHHSSGGGGDDPVTSDGRWHNARVWHNADTWENGY